MAGKDIVAGDGLRRIVLIQKCELHRRIAYLQRPFQLDYLYLVAGFVSHFTCGDRYGRAGCQTNIMTNITSDIPIIIRFSDRLTKPRGTLELPPTHAHFSSRLSI